LSLPGNREGNYTAWMVCVFCRRAALFNNQLNLTRNTSHHLWRASHTLPQVLRRVTGRLAKR